MSIRSELLRKQNFYKLMYEFACKKSKQNTVTVWVSNMVGKTERSRIPEFMIGQTFSFSHCNITIRVLRGAG